MWVLLGAWRHREVALGGQAPDGGDSVLRMRTGRWGGRETGTRWEAPQFPACCSAVQPGSSGLTHEGRGVRGRERSWAGSPASGTSGMGGKAAAPPPPPPPLGGELLLPRAGREGSSESFSAGEAGPCTAAVRPDPTGVLDTVPAESPGHATSTPPPATGMEAQHPPNSLTCVPPRTGAPWEVTRPPWRP